MARDDFDKATRQALAQRAGYLCSFPGCGFLTVGPSDEAVDATSGTGMACHIAAASGGPGARRFRPEMSSGERSSIDNGLWLCYTHGKLIDADESRFTIPMLKKWRELAELRARFLQEQGGRMSGRTLDLSMARLAESTSRLTSLNSENELIGDAIRFACVPEIWGPDIAERVRDFVIEYARNAFKHGAASSFEMDISPDRIRLSDDGHDFDMWSLPEDPAGGGGTLALRALLDRMSDRLVVVSRRDGRKNEIVVARIVEAYEIEDLTPCVTTISWKDVRERTYQIEVPPSCKVVYVLLPRYWAPSDCIQMVKKLRKEAHDPRRLIFVLKDTSQVSRALIADAFPESRIVCM